MGRHTSFIQYETFRNVTGGNVMLNTATARRGSQAGGGFTFTTSWFEGEIYVNNLSFAKEVGVAILQMKGRHGAIRWVATLAPL